MRAANGTPPGIFDPVGVEQDLAAIREVALVSARNAARTGSRNSLIHLSQNLHIRADSLISSIQSAHPAPACRKGCDFCCHGLIPATSPELLDLAQTVETWDEIRKTALRARLAQYNEESKKYWRFDSYQFDSACPFLVEGECSVYEQRPFFCRGKNSYDAGDCERQMRGEAVPLRVVPGQHETGSCSVEGVVQGLKQAGRYSGTYDLGSGMEILLDNPRASEQFAEGLEDPLDNVKMASDANVRLRHLNDAAKRFLKPEFARCFGPGITPEAQYRAATELAKTNPYAVLGQILLPPFYNSEDEREEWWNRYEAAVERLAGLDLDPAIAFESADLRGAVTFGLAYSGRNVRQILERLAGIFHGYAAKAHPHLIQPVEGPRRPGKFRLGYVSRQLKFNNASSWALGWVTEHSPEIETYAFNLNESHDNVSTRWRRNVDHYFHWPIPAVEVCDKIRAFDLDALIFTDVGSDGISFQLAMLRSARCQLAAWGFPMTTGSPEMDYYISSEEMEPSNGQDHYSERLLLLPGSAQTFPKARRSQPSDKSARDLGLPKGGFLLIAQNPTKLLPNRDVVFREISERTGKPIVICNSVEGDIGSLVAERMRRAGARVHVLPFLTDSNFFRVMKLADVVLDSFDFGGGITSVDALALLKPPVSCPGEFMRARMCIPYMKQAGVADMMTTSVEAYIELACDAARIADAAERCNPEAIYRDLRPIRALDEFLLGLIR